MSTITPIQDLHAATRRVAEADAVLLEALQSWRVRIEAELSGLSTAFDRQVAAVTAPGGLFDDVVSKEPRLHRRVQVLGGKQRGLRAALDQALADLADPRMVTNPHRIKGLHALVHEVVEGLTRYESRAMSLSFDAYNVDLGDPV
jgi:hypothetical protein